MTIVVAPPGDGPAWLPHLLRVFDEAAGDSGPTILVVGSRPLPASTLPGQATFLPRGESLPRSLAERMATIRAERVAAAHPVHAMAAPVRSFVQLATIGMTAARKAPLEAVLYLDLACGATVATAHPTGVEVLHEPDGDQSAAASILQRVGAKEIARWIPSPTDDAALRTWVERRNGVAAAGQATSDDWSIARGFARAALRGLIARSNVRQVITRCIVGSSLLQLGTPVEVTALVADVLPSPAHVEVFADRDDLLAAAGYLSEHSPSAALPFIAHDLLVPLGTIIIAPATGGREATIVAVVPEHSEGPRTTIAPKSVTHLGTPGSATVRLIRRDGSEEFVALSGGAGGTLIDTRTRPTGRVATVTETTRVSDRLRASLAPSVSEA